MRFKPAVDSLEQRDTPSGLTAVAPLVVTAQVSSTYRPPPTPWVPHPYTVANTTVYPTTGTSTATLSSSFTAATTYYVSAIPAYPIDQLS